jgi:hypothetical protein
LETAVADPWFLLLSAVTAHSSYFHNADFQNFLIGILGQHSDSKVAAAASDERKQSEVFTPNLSPAVG